MFDGMPMGGNRRKLAVSGGGIDALPDDILGHILGFLPAPEAVRTCVLARRWRVLWKRATSLRITGAADNAQGRQIVKERQKFVDRLLRLRGHAPLQMCDLRFGHFYDDDDEVLLNQWFRRVVTCGVRIFRLENLGRDDFHLKGMPLVSQHLTRLELVGVGLRNMLCNFSSCPSLEHLEIGNCYWCSDINISSESLKHLAITNCDLGIQLRTLIYVPNLVSLMLDGHLSCAPVLGCMPLLQDAFVRVTHENYPDSYFWDCDYEDCYSCYGIIHGNNICIFLESLSGAENLALISEFKTFVFGRDLEQCPTFSKLKTLVLDDHWCVAPDFPALNCILKHLPVLEKLTLQLFSKGPQHKIEMIARLASMDRSVAVSEHLKAIEIKCEVVGEEVHKVLKFLCSFNISFMFK